MTWPIGKSSRRGTTLTTLLLLTACVQQPNGPSSGNHDGATFSSNDYHVTVSYPPSLRRVAESNGGYFDTGSWQFSDGVPGERLLTLELTGSNVLMRGRWRLGASRDNSAVESCLTRPKNAQNSGQAVHIAGHEFMSFTLGDAGMSHFQRVEEYRSVIDGTCYAIDLIVNGTRGEVYTPPRQPPFDQAQAFERLESINDHLTFDRS